MAHNQPRWGQVICNKGLDVLRMAIRVLGKGYGESVVIVFDFRGKIWTLIMVHH